MVFENGAGEGEPVVGFDLALPLVNLVVAADAAEFVEEFSEVGGVLGKVLVVFEEVVGALVEWHGDLVDDAGGEFFPEVGGEVDGADAVGFGLEEDGLAEIGSDEGFVDASFESLLGWLCSD